MKNLKVAILFVAISLGAFKASAQSTTFKPFKVDLAVGVGLPFENGSTAGILFAVEPKYSISDQITLGLRLESSLSGYEYQFSTSTSQSFSSQIKSTNSYLATADYMFSKKTLRPFAGLGMGIYSISAIDLTDSSIPLGVSYRLPSSTRFGFAPRVGIEASHFRTALEYNFAGKANGVSYNYLALKVGFFLGGGKK